MRPLQWASAHVSRPGVTRAYRTGPAGPAGPAARRGGTGPAPGRRGGAHQPLRHDRGRRGQGCSAPPLPQLRRLLRGARQHPHPPVRRRSPGCSIRSCSPWCRRSSRGTRFAGPSTAAAARACRRSPRPRAPGARFCSACGRSLAGGAPAMVPSARPWHPSRTTRPARLSPGAPVPDDCVGSLSAPRPDHSAPEGPGTRAPGERRDSRETHPEGANGIRRPPAR
jgi:hypothetical protein